METLSRVLEKALLSWQVILDVVWGFSSEEDLFWKCLYRRILIERSSRVVGLLFMFAVLLIFAKGS